MPSNIIPGGMGHQIPKSTNIVPHAGGAPLTPKFTPPLVNATIPSEASTTLDAMMSAVAEAQLQYALLRIRDFVSQSYISSLSGNVKTKAGKVRPHLRVSHISVYRLASLYYDSGENIYEKLTSVYTALNMHNSGVALIIRGTKTGCNLYIAVTSDSLENKVLECSMKGQFPGSIIIEEDNTSIASIVGSQCSYVQSVSFVPARRNSETSQNSIESSQGIEKVADALRGLEYTIILLAESMLGEDVIERSKGLEALSTIVSSFEKASKSIAENDSSSRAVSESKTISNSTNETIGKSYGVSRSTTHTDSTSKGSGSSMPCSFLGMTFSDSSGKSISISESNGTTSGSSESWGKAYSEAVAQGLTTTTSTGKTVTSTFSRESKTVKRLQALIDSQLDRLDVGLSRGMWQCCCYVCGDDISAVSSAAGITASVLSGDSKQPLPMFRNIWSKSEDTNGIMNWLSDLQHPHFDVGADDERIITTPALLVNGLEIAGFLPLPRKSMPGIVVSETAEFARSITYIDRHMRPDFLFGKVVHMHKEENTDIPYNTGMFSAHCLITGAAGSGKSNTTYHLLDQLIQKGIRYMVIEPVKGDYKKKFGGYPKLKIYTVVDDSYRMLRLNPFVFPEAHIKISTHIDKLRQTVCACWPLYGTMSGILKTAFEEAYRSCGWDLTLSRCVREAKKKWPSFSDLARETKRIIESAGYSKNSENDYKGALLLRIQSLMTGLERDIFCEGEGLSDQELFENNVIVDLSSIGSDDTRALIMGLLIAKLRNYRAAMQKDADVPTQHVVVLEEAHNILKRCSHESGEDSGNTQGESVKAIVNSIAEMRTYGEGFFIVDQSPSAVDRAAIQNTAVKIVMRLQDAEDIKAVQSAMSLSDEQAEEISRLPRGEAIVNQQGWLEPVLARMGGAWKGLYPSENQPKTCTQSRLLEVRSMIAALIYDVFARDNMEQYSVHLVDEIRNYLDALSENPHYAGISLGYADDIISLCSEFVSSYMSITRTKRKDKHAMQIGHVSDFLIRLLKMDEISCQLPKIKCDKMPDGSFKYVKDTVLKWWRVFSVELYPKYVRAYVADSESFSCREAGSSASDQEFVEGMRSRIGVRIAINIGLDYKELPVKIRQ